MSQEMFHALGVLNHLLDFKYQLLIEYLSSFDRGRAEHRADIVTTRLRNCHARGMLHFNDLYSLKVAVAFVQHHEVMWLRFINDFVCESNAAEEAQEIITVLRGALKPLENTNGKDSAEKSRESRAGNAGTATPAQ